jgi:hypothetical protein
MLNNKIKKKIKNNKIKLLESTQARKENLQPRSWGHVNFIESKLKKNNDRKSICVYIFINFNMLIKINLFLNNIFNILDLA